LKNLFFYRLSAIRIIFLAYFLLMIGYAYAHLFWETPYHAFIWAENIFGPLVEFFHYNWTEFSSSPLIPQMTNFYSYLMGVLFFLSAIIIVYPVKPLFQKSVIKASALFFLIFILINWFDHDLYVSSLLEKSEQICTVLIVYILINKREIPAKLFQYLIKISIALTFTFHGLYALNVFPLPGSFTDMVITILKMNEAHARNFLAVIGLLDILISFGVFYKKTEKISFIYAVIWGFLTAFARIAVNVSLDNWILGLHRWIFEFLIRTPHFLLPFAGMVVSVQNIKKLNGFNYLRGKEIA